MRLEFAFLADAAKLSPSGVFDALGGGLEVFSAPSYPATLHNLVFVIRIAFEPDECGKSYDFEADVLDKDGLAIFAKTHGQIKTIPHPRDSNRPNTMTISINYEDVKFQSPGDYTFNLHVSTKRIGQVFIEAVKENAI